MIVETLTLDYTPDALTQRFATLAHLPWAMLLSSAQASHSDCPSLPGIVQRPRAASAPE